MSFSFIGDWNAKVGGQEIPRVTGKFGLGVQNEERQKLTKEFFQENTLVIANTLFQQHKRRLCTWTSPDDQHWNQIDYILCRQRWRSSIKSAKIRLGADCDSDQELLNPNSKSQDSDRANEKRDISIVRELTHGIAEAGKSKVSRHGQRPREGLMFQLSPKAIWRHNYSFLWGPQSFFLSRPSTD